MRQTATLRLHGTLVSASLSLSVCLLLGLFAVSPSFARKIHTAAGAHAPDFTLPTGSGNISLTDLRGKVVWVDFFASWCPPCHESFPWLGRMSQRYAANGLVVVAIDLDKQREAANLFLRDLSPPFVVAFDPDGKTAAAYGVKAMPSSYLVSRDGKIISVHRGFREKEEKTLQNEIEEALQP